MDNPVLETAPQNPAYTLADVKAHLRVAHTDDDDLITGLCDAAVAYIQEYTGRQLVTATWAWFLESFSNQQRAAVDDYWFQPYPSGLKGAQIIQLPILPVSGITSIAYTDTAGNSQTLTENTDFVLDTVRGRIKPSAALSMWPQVSSDVFNPIEIQFEAGYGADAGDVPVKITQALYMLVAYWYDNRENSTILQLNQVPDGFSELLIEYRKRVF